MDTLDSLVTIGIPALVGLLGWIVLRQRNSPPLLAGCMALFIALGTLAIIFALMFVL